MDAGSKNGTKPNSVLERQLPQYYDEEPPCLPKIIQLAGVVSIGLRIRFTGRRPPKWILATLVSMKKIQELVFFNPDCQTKSKKNSLDSNLVERR